MTLKIVVNDNPNCPCCKILDMDLDGDAIDTRHVIHAGVEQAIERITETAKQRNLDVMVVRNYRLN